MPQVRSGESEADFVKRCIPYLINEGKHPNTPKGRKAAAGECYGIYRNKADDIAPSGSTDFVPQEDVLSRNNSEYIIPKGIDELKEGHIVKYKDKIGKIVKVISHD